MQTTNASRRKKGSQRQPWFDRLTKRVAAPHPSIKEVGARRQASLLAWVALILSLTLLVGILASMAIKFPGPVIDASTLILMGLFLFTLLVYALGRMKYYRIGSIFLVIGFTLMAYVDIFITGELVISNVLVIFIPVTLVLGSVLLSIPEMAVLVGVNIAGVIFLWMGIPELSMEDVALNLAAVIVTGSLLLGTMVYRNAVQRDRLAEARTLAEVEAVNVELEKARVGLENAVAERTRALELSVQISQRISRILEPDQLVTEVVKQIKEAFNYYHVHIYLAEEAANKLVMVGGTGEAGYLMVEHGHTILRGQGLVGRAAETGSVVLVPDTRKDPDWLPNMLLPDTKSELAVPIGIGDQVLGVLDVQQNVAGSLGQQDADLLLSIGNQVAVALRNASQISTSQEQAEREAQTNIIIQQIQNTQTTEEALQVTIRELGRALNVPHTHARLALSQDDGNGQN